MGIVVPLRGRKPLHVANSTPASLTSNPTWRELKEGLQERSLQSIGVELTRRVLLEAMEQEADELCGGEKGRHLKSERNASRHGNAPCSVPYGSARMKLSRPRLRSNGKEVLLSTYIAARDGGFPLEAVLKTCLDGASQRRYPETARRLQETGSNGFHHYSKSTINRRFVAAADKVRKTLQTRQLDGRRFLALYIDGTVEQGHHIISVLGLTEDGEKMILGLREGSSESSEVCQELFTNLLSRGLDVSRGFLAVIDGGKGLASALRSTFGHKAILQRCRAHKTRNVLEKVPECERDHLKRYLQRAWSETDPRQAKRLLELTARNLEARGRRRAARSLREGLSDTLACNFLGLPSDCDLTRSLVTTNPIESLNGYVADRARRVCRWRSGRMFLRWTAISMAEAEASFSRIDNSVGLHNLKTALEKRATLLKAAA
ncbi:MAG: transposase [Vulcanimicrobiota bacterium]